MLIKGFKDYINEPGCSSVYEIESNKREAIFSGIRT